jgi:hypothetical protein
MGPHIIDCTDLADDRTVWIIGPGYTLDDLTEEEREKIADSKKYLKDRKAKQNEQLLKQAYQAFEALRDIVKEPEAIAILKEWVYRDEDELDEEDE